MQANIHNKFEIINGDETYTAYNCVSHNMLDRMSSFSPFASYFAFGNSSGQDSYLRDKMQNWILSLSSTLEDIQCDISKGDIYVKRTVTIPENQYNGLMFSEIGVTYSNEENPTICNHVNIVDGNNNVVQVRKKNGIPIFIRVTIYLNFSNDAKKILCSGENMLIKSLLGENESPIFSAKRGTNTFPNTQSIFRNVPRVGQSYPCTIAVTKAIADASFNISIDYDIDTGSTAEIVLVSSSSAVARQNALEYATADNITEELTSQQNKTIVLDEFVDEVISIVDENSQAVSGVVEQEFATDFSDYINNPFDATINDSNLRFVSNDGNKIAFVSANKLYIYKNEIYSFKKIDNNIDVSNLQNVIIFEDNVFVIYNAYPHIAMYKIVANSLVKKSIDLTNYTLFDTTFDWRDIEIISNGQNSFMFGIILGQIVHKPVVVCCTYANDVLTVDSAVYGQVQYASHVFAIYKNSYCNSKIGFITDCYNNTQDNYRIEEHSFDGATTVSKEIPAYYLSQNATKIKGKSRAVIAWQSVAPYIWIYYYPEVARYNISLTSGIDNWISTDLKYIVQKYNDIQTPYKIYSLSNYNSPVEFENGFPQDLDMSQITDFEFVGDTLLLFSTTSVVALNMKQTKKLIENLPQANAAYTVAYSKLNLIGTSSDEGINGSLSMELMP